MTDFLAGLDEFLASFSPAERAVSGALFRALLSGRPVPSGEVASVTGLPATEAAAALDRLVDRGSVMLDPASGAIVGARGLSLRPTAHRLTLDGRALFAFCAIDAIGIPVALGAEATIESRCAGCRTPLALTVTAGALIGADPAVVIWATGRDPGRSLHEHT